MWFKNIIIKTQNLEIVNHNCRYGLCPSSHVFNLFLCASSQVCNFKGPFILDTAIALLYRTAVSCDVTLRCRMKVIFILTWNAVTCGRDVIDISAPQRNYGVTDLNLYIALIGVHVTTALVTLQIIYFEYQ